MVRYTEEQKTQALQSIAEIGVAKTSEAMGITAQTLYKWKNAGEDGAVKGTKHRKKKGSAQSKYVELGADEGEYLSKIATLEQENAKLRDTNAKLRKALASFID